MECYKEPEWFPLDDDNPAQPHKLCSSRPLSAHCFVGYARAEDCSLDGGDMMKKAAANSARAVALADTTTTANSTPHTGPCTCIWPWLDRARLWGEVPSIQAWNFEAWA